MIDFKTFKAQDKAELHIHLEGSLTPERIALLAADQPRSCFQGKDPETATEILKALTTRFEQLQREIPADESQKTLPF